MVDRSGAGPDRIDPSALRWLIGHELRAAREQAGHTQSAAARVLGCTHAKINYLEQGKNQQRPDEVGMLLRSYGAEAGDVERVVGLRLARQQRLYDRGRPLHYEAVIEETILDRLVGGPAVMAEQLDHLVALSAQDNVTIRVMPLAVAVHDGLDGEFTLLDFDAARSIGYVEFQDGAVYVQDPDRIGGYRTAAARLRDAALPEDTSLEVIRDRRAALGS